MARRLQIKSNVVAPAGDYPYGRIKDNTGSGNGTPVNEAVYGDFHQFFAKLLAESGLTPNDLPENVTNGFQYYDSLFLAPGTPWVLNDAFCPLANVTCPTTAGIDIETCKFNAKRIGNTVHLHGEIRLTITSYGAVLASDIYIDPLILKPKHASPLGEILGSFVLGESGGSGYFPGVILRASPGKIILRITHTTAPPADGTIYTAFFSCTYELLI